MNSNGYVNKIMLIGNLGRTPELRYTEKGTACLPISICTNRDIKNEQGDKEKEANWHRATVWGKHAEACAKYLTKGQRVYIEGELLMRNWEDKDGNKRTSAEIWVGQLTMLGKPHQSGNDASVEDPTNAVAVAF